MACYIALVRNPGEKGSVIADPDCNCFSAFWSSEQAHQDAGEGGAGHRGVVGNCVAGAQSQQGLGIAAGCHSGATGDLVDGRAGNAEQGTAADLLELFVVEEFHEVD